jgi:hypothetical protein
MNCVGDDIVQSLILHLFLCFFTLSFLSFLPFHFYLELSTILRLAVTCAYLAQGKMEQVFRVGSSKRKCIRCGGGYKSQIIQEF